MPEDCFLYSASLVPFAQVSLYVGGRYLLVNCLVGFFSLPSALQARHPKVLKLSSRPSYSDLANHLDASIVCIRSEV